MNDNELDPSVVNTLHLYLWSRIDAHGECSFENLSRLWDEVDLGFKRGSHHDRTLTGVVLPEALVDCLREIVRWHDARHEDKPCPTT